MISRPLVAVTLFGFVMSVTQVTLLREALSVSSGNEMSIALGLTVWLLGTALGAGLGSLVAPRRAKAALSAVGMLAAFAPFGALLPARCAAEIFRQAPGEFLTFGQQLLGNCLALGPVCLLIGATFTLACNLPDLRPREVYFAEAVGWLLGGMAVTWALITLNPFLIFSLLAFVMIAAILLLNDTGWAPLLVIVAGGLLVPYLSWPRQMEASTLALRWPGQRIVAGAYSPYGHGAILESGGQKALYENGHLALVLPEYQSAEELAHLTLLQVEDPARIFLAGSLGGLLPEVLKHPVSEVFLAEQDPTLTRLAIAAADPETRAALDDPRVRLLYGDGRRLLRQEQRGWDAVLLNLPEPSTALLNRFYTVEFFREVRRSLQPGGVLIFRMPGAENYYGPELLARNGSIYGALSSVFPHVFVTPLSTNYFLAAGQPLISDGLELGRRLAASHITTRWIHTQHFIYMLPEGRSEALMREYAGSRRVNRDLEPVAYLHTLALRQREESGALFRVLHTVAVWNPGGTAAVTLVLLAGGSLLSSNPGRRGRLKRWRVLLAVALVGYAGMALSILLLMLAQQSLGALYHLLGALVAMSMAGMALGAWGAGLLPARALPTPAVLGLGLALALPVFAPLAPSWPYGAALSALLAMMFLGGVTVGAVFPLAVDHGLAPGAVYCSDLLGAAVAGLLTAVVLLPVHGLNVAALLLSALLGLAILLTLKLGP